MKAKATKRAMATAARVVSNNEGNGNGNVGGRGVTATGAMAVVMTVVGKYEGSGSGDEGGRQ